MVVRSSVDGAEGVTEVVTMTVSEELIVATSLVIVL